MPSSPSGFKQELRIFGLLFTLVFLFLFFWYGLALPRWDGFFARTAASLVPYPALRVNGSFISFHRIFSQARQLNSVAISEFFIMPDVTNDEVLDLAADLLVQDRLADQLAKDLRVSVSNKEIDEAYDAFLSEYNYEKSEWKKKLKDELGMRESQFLNQVLEPFLLMQKIEEAIFASEIYQQSVTDRAELALERLGQGMSFGDIAAAYSDDYSEYDGDLGFFFISDIPQEWLGVLELEVYEWTHIIESGDAYYVLMQTDTIGTDDEIEQIRLSAMVFRKLGAREVLSDYARASRIRSYIPSYSYSLSP